MRAITIGAAAVMKTAASFKIWLSTYTVIKVLLLRIAAQPSYSGHAGGVTAVSTLALAKIASQVVSAVSPCGISARPVPRAL